MSLEIYFYLEKGWKMRENKLAKQIQTTQILYYPCTDLVPGSFPYSVRNKKSVSAVP